MASPRVQDAAVSVLRREGGVSLVGFVVWQENTDADPVRLRPALTEHAALVHGPGPDRGAAAAAGECQRQAGWPRLGSVGRGARCPLSLAGGAESAYDRYRADRCANCSQSNSTAWCRTSTTTSSCSGWTASWRSRWSTRRDGADSRESTDGVHRADNPPTRGRDRRGGRTRIRGLAGAEYGEVLPLPMVSWLYEHGNYRRFTHTVLLRLPSDIDRPSIELMLQHAARRTRHPAVDPGRHARRAAPGHPRTRRRQCR